MSKHESPLSTHTVGDETPKQPVNLGRRRLSRAALATPVIATLAARPAMACSVSGFISGNTSPGHGDYQCSGYGCTPGFWKGHPDIWIRVTNGLVSGGQLITINPCTSQPKDCTYWSSSGGTTLVNVLGGFNPFGVDSTKPLLDLLEENSGQPVYHFIAAWLNATASAVSYGSTPEEVIQGLVKAKDLGKVHEYGQLLDSLNNRGCMFDAHGDCAAEGDLQFIYSQDLRTCIPKCKSGYKFDPVSMQCVPI